MKRLGSLCFWGVLALLLGFAVSAKADVSGFFETRVLMTPQTSVSEIALIDFDVENDLTLTLLTSGISFTFHTHFGIAGLEDAIVTTNAAIGFLNISSRLVFARFAAFQITPFYNSLRFILKKVDASLNIGGVTLTNRALFEDTNAFISQTPAFAFGDTVQIQGSTPSGIGVSAIVGICAGSQASSIKKHIAVSSFSVNPDCATEPKPDLLFDFERITITNIPIIPDVTGSARINCVLISECGLVVALSFGGGPIPFTAGLTFSDLFDLSFNGASIRFLGGDSEILFRISPQGTLSSVSVVIESDFSPDPLAMRISASFVPGIGLTSAEVGLSVGPIEGVQLGLLGLFSGGPPAELTTVIATVLVQRAPISLEAEAEFTPDELKSADLVFTIDF